jgi:hypothetical protein
MACRPDSQDYRGPAGVVCDAFGDVAPGAEVLVVEGARWPTCELRALVDEHRRAQADITIGVNGDGSPSGIYLVRGSTIQQIPKLGYLDIKEQWLKRVRDSGGRLRTARFPGRGIVPVRTREGFLAVARDLAVYGRVVGEIREIGSVLVDPGGAEHFVVIEPGAVVASDAVVVDSVVMDGARIGAGAVVARSIIGPGAIVGDGEEVVGCLVRSAGRNA